MMMNRRTFSTALLTGAAASLISTRGMAANATPKNARNIVLVHGLFADGSCWSEVIARLQTAGLNVTSVQNPLTTLPEAVASAERVLARQDGPTVLVGHSFSGMIVTEAGVHPNVSALVYVAARAPDADEDYTALAKTYPTPPATAGIVFDGDEGRLSEEAFLRDFAGDLPEAKARVLYAVQEPFHKALLTGKTKGQDGSGGRNAERDFHGEKRKNDTHSSTTDRDARLFRKGAGKEAKLCHMGHLMMENRNGLIIDARLTEANGTAERTTALDMIEDNAKSGSTVGGDKNYDTADFVAGCRERGCTPHVSQNDTNRRSAIDARTTRHPGYRISTIKRKRIEEPFGWMKTVGGLRKTRHRGRGLVEWFFVLTATAYNLIRIPKILAATG